MMLTQQTLKMLVSFSSQIRTLIGKIMCVQRTSHEYDDYSDFVYPFQFEWPEEPDGEE